jgi:hypothetical protein
MNDIETPTHGSSITSHHSTHVFSTLPSPPLPSLPFASPPLPPLDVEARVKDRSVWGSNAVAAAIQSMRDVEVSHPQGRDGWTTMVSSATCKDQASPPVMSVGFFFCCLPVFVFWEPVHLLSVVLIDLCVCFVCLCVCVRFCVFDSCCFPCFFVSLPILHGVEEDR